MHLFNFKKALNASQIIVYIALTQLLPGCEGGMVGTGTGPATDAYQLENLPERISPDIPRTILNNEDPSQIQPEEPDITEVEAMLSRIIRNSTLEKAQGWQELNDEIVFVTVIQLFIKSNATLIDLAFDDIQAECDEQPVDCIIPSGKLQVTISQDVINRLVQLNIEWAESLSTDYVNIEEDWNEFIQQLNEDFADLLDTKVVFGETRYSQLNVAPYDHVVHTHLIRESEINSVDTFVLWRDEEFFASWLEDGSLAKFRTIGKDEEIQEYFYQNGAPGELIVANNFAKLTENIGNGFYAKVIGNDNDNAGILLDLLSTSFVYGSSSDAPVTVSGPVDGASPEDSPSPVTDSSEPEANDSVVENPSPLYQSLDFFQGQMDNDGGYTRYVSRFVDLDDNDSLTLYEEYRESFDSLGNLLAGERCSFDVFIGGEMCNDSNFESHGPEGSSLTDSVHYFKPEDFDSLVAIQDAVRWQLEGLPEAITIFAVVSADQSTDLSDRELLCRGFQFIRNEVRIFCSASDDQLENTTVVELSSDVPSRIIPGAVLVQIQ